MPKGPWLGGFSITVYLLVVSSVILSASCRHADFGLRFPTPKPPEGFVSLSEYYPDEHVYLPSFDDQGQRIAVLGSQNNEDELPTKILIIDLEKENIVFQSEEYYGSSISLSPDGTQYASSIGDTAIVYDLTTNGPIIEISGANPSWSPDGQKIVFMNTTEKYEHPENLLRISAVELTSGIETVLYEVADPSGYVSDIDWSPDETSLVFAMTLSRDRPGRTQDLYVLNLKDDELRRLTEGWSVWDPNFSIDGNSILFFGSPDPWKWTSRFDLYVMRLDGDCHRIKAPVPIMQGVELSSDEQKIALASKYGVLLANTTETLGENFWQEGELCRR